MRKTMRKNALQAGDALALVKGELSETRRIKLRNAEEKAREGKIKSKKLKLKNYRLNEGKSIFHTMGK